MIDEQLRKQAAAIFARMGLSEEEAVALFYKRTVEAGKMPFGPASEGPAKAKQKKKKQKKKRMNERFAEWDAF